MINFDLFNIISDASIIGRSFSIGSIECTLAVDYEIPNDPFSAMTIANPSNSPMAMQCYMPATSAKFYH